MTETSQDRRTLILISVGPVQDFIKQARRTRDLWFGSHILSEISRAVARSLSEEGATLIFPAFEPKDSELKPCDRFERLNTPSGTPNAQAEEREASRFRENGRAPVNVSNKILALLPSDKNAVAAACVIKARQAATDELNKFAQRVWKCFEKDHALAPNSRPLWDEQLATALEYSAAWVCLGDGDEAYKSALTMLEERLAGRKNLREFQSWTEQGKTARPKSSLDGARDSVLREGEERKNHPIYARYRISKGEQLDAVGLIKRAGGRPDQFVPIARVALAQWINTAVKYKGNVFQELQNWAESHKLGSIQHEGRGWLRSFEYDAQLFLESRWKAIAEELAFDPKDQADLQTHAGKALRGAAKVVVEAPHGHKIKLGEPSPYVACLVADGDRVGGALDKMKSSDQHRTFSKCLAKFAEGARHIVEHDHKGVLIYAGGDDVLAFVCLADAVFCADKLQEAFVACMKEAKEDLGSDWPKDDDGVEVKLPTLSVGLGVGHILEGMGDLLDLGRSAENLAKGDGLPEKEQRNALGVIADKRSGGQHKWRVRWDQGAVEAWKDSLWLTYDHNARAVSSKKIYELRAMADRLPKPERLKKLDNPDPGGWYNILRQETQRILGRSGLGLASQADDQTVASIDQAIFGPPANEATQAGADERYRQAQEALRGWVDRMLLARMLPQADRAAHEIISAHIKTQAETQGAKR